MALFLLSLASLGVFFFFIILFIFGCTGFPDFVWASSSCGEQGLRFVALCCAGFSLQWLPCCRAQALGVRASVLVAHGLSSSVACAVFPDQRSNPCPLHWQADSYPLHYLGNLQVFYYSWLWHAHFLWDIVGGNSLRPEIKIKISFLDVLHLFYPDAWGTPIKLLDQPSVENLGCWCLQRPAYDCYFLKTSNFYCPSVLSVKVTFLKCFWNGRME